VIPSEARARADHGSLESEHRDSERKREGEENGESVWRGDEAGGGQMRYAGEDEIGLTRARDAAEGGGEGQK
jgi:hypothetical protein